MKELTGHCALIIKKGSFVQTEAGEIFFLAEDLYVHLDANPKVHDMEMSHLYNDSPAEKQDIDF